MQLMYTPTILLGFLSTIPSISAFSTIIPGKTSPQTVSIGKLFPSPHNHNHNNAFRLFGKTSSETESEISTTVIDPDSVYNPNLTPQEEEQLAQKFQGYTVKQRLREEVESPFRKVRLVFFLSSAGSALTALYFSALNVLKASGAVGTFTETPPLEEALTSSAINVGGVIICGALAYRDYQVGQVNLERIAQGGRLAKLMVLEGQKDMSGSVRRTLSDYRRFARVVLCVGGKEYIENVNRSMNADQLKDTNMIAERLLDVDVKVVPVCLSSEFTVGDSENVWRSTEAGDDEVDRNYDGTRADGVIAFPQNANSWEEYLKSEIQTALDQGFDVLEKGFTITVKKNGRILKRATGMPQWGNLIGSMEVMDGSKFGMPGDSEKYGGKF